LGLHQIYELVYNMKARKKFLFGAGETAAMLINYFKSDTQEKISGVIIDDDVTEKRHFISELPIIRMRDFLQLYSPSEADILVALAYSKMNSLRMEKHQYFQSLGYGSFNYISSRAYLDPTISIGLGNIILEMNVLQYQVEIGHCNVLWSGNHIGHGTKIGNANWITSHVVVSGKCVIGDNNFIGVNATLNDKIQLCNRLIIPSHAKISKSVPDSDAGYLLGPYGELTKIKSNNIY
jgi:sugar O-acyltransferase (sialic acid O-acetyltransferase NeuD family)